ncbi:MAG: putative metal-binding motif-containing protein [Deltaproteobacteria bacterium]|nr:putative metal-binding motif-containing protein [Deltaproteobacteria bacterium]
MTLSKYKQVVVSVLCFLFVLLLVVSLPAFGKNTSNNTPSLKNIGQIEQDAKHSFKCRAAFEEWVERFSGEKKGYTKWENAFRAAFLSRIKKHCNWPPEGYCINGDTVSVWYADFDADGFGDDANSEEACEAPDGYIENAGDCDDANAAINNGVIELCDEIDNNCDGAVDEGLTINRFYADHDGDGYGDVTESIETCHTEVSGFVGSSADCNDAAAAVHPDARESAEFGTGECDDGIDQNCDGVDVACNGIDADRDGHASKESGGDDCDDTHAGVYLGASEICDNMDNDCNSRIDENFVLGEFCSVGKGACYASGVVVCSDDGLSTQCNAIEGLPRDEACGGGDDDCDGFIDEDPVDARNLYTDFDSDGFGGWYARMQSCYNVSDFVNNSIDCNDARYAANPFEREKCDGIDNDCDHQIDEGCYCVPQTEICGDGLDQDCNGSDLACNGDVDGDGDGYRPLDGDCDDADAHVYPHAREYCDGVDNNCDHVIDEYSAVDAPTWYYDLDGDGHGGFMPRIISCDPVEEDWTTIGGDCNDYDSYVNPEWFEECGDGVDNNCDGNIDEWC